MKILMIVAIVALVIAAVLPYGKLSITDRGADITRKVVAVFLAAVSIAYFISSF